MGRRDRSLRRMACRPHLRCDEDRSQLVGGTSRDLLNLRHMNNYVIPLGNAARASHRLRPLGVSIAWRSCTSLMVRRSWLCRGKICLDARQVVANLHGVLGATQLLWSCSILRRSWSAQPANDPPSTSALANMGLLAAVLDPIGLLNSRCCDGAALPADYNDLLFNIGS